MSRCQREGRRFESGPPLQTMKKILTAIFLIITAVIIIPIMSFFLFLGALQFEPIIKFNTVFTHDFKIEAWEEEIKSEMTRKEVQKLLGIPLRIHEQTRCDFYSKSKIRWLNFYEYKVCYDGNEKFFLKLKFRYQESPLGGDQWQ